MSLAVDDLKVHYRTLAGDVRALDGVTFDVADAEIMGLAGESGCGKSTLAKALTRLESRMRYVGGTAMLDGVPLPLDDQKAMNPFRYRELSLIPQYAMSALNPTRKIGKLVDDLVASRGGDPDAAHAELERRLELVGLSRDVLGLYPIELSGGMKQRTVMVVSTLLDPSLLIADEITSALDVTSQRAVATLLVDFRDRAFVKSVIVITHDLSVLAQIADTILVMYAGRLAEKAPTAEVIDAPLHPYTKMLIASLPEVGVRFAEHRLRGIPGHPPPLLHPAAGCRFRDRCPLAHARCAEQPPFGEVARGHSVACWAVEGA